jgi:hypothetical protein
METKRNKRSMKTWGATPRRETLFHSCQMGRERNIDEDKWL